MLFGMVKRPETLQRDVAKKFSGRAMKVLVETLEERRLVERKAQDGTIEEIDAGPSQRALDVAKWLLEWAEGKAPQSVSSTLDVNVSIGMHLDALRQLSTKTIEHVTSDALKFLE